MTPRDTNPDRDEAASIDLLVDGELTEDARRSLLAHLETSPGGWRRCALAFLEAQAWRSAFSEVDSAGTPAVPSTIALPERPRRMLPWLAMAAASFLAFGAGWIARPDPIPTAPMVAEVQKPPKPEVHPEPVVATNTAEVPPPANYVRGRMEREGFRFEEKRIIVPARTRDGRAVAVPVRRTTVRYVGNRTI